MVAARDMGELLAAPIGRYLTGASFVIGVRHTRIAMIHTAPTLDRADVPTLVGGVSLPTHQALAARYDMLHDAAAIRGADETAYELFAAWLGEWIDQFAHRVRKVGVVRPEGVAGAGFAGMYRDWVAPRFDARLCLTRTEAYDFLEVPHAERAELDELSRPIAPVVRKLREALAQNLLDSSIESMAQRIGISRRSLQRALSSHGTTFRRELDDARIREARARLTSSDAAIEVISSAVGFSTIAAFARMFVREVGESPAAFRARARGR